ncbi:TPA: hypothetical protein ACH3X2_006058 [Trebouxia sp. C0005]
MAYTSLPSLTAWWQSALAHNPCHRLSARSHTTVSVPHKQPSPAAMILSCKSSRHVCNNHLCANHKQTRTKLRHRVCPAAGEHIADVFDINSADTNQLQTALNRAIAAEDYTLASQVRDQLQHVLGAHIGTADWRQLGVPEWLADRVERMGFKYATEVQKRAAGALQEGRDIMIQSQTGSGKTLAFLLPLLSALRYPPDLYPEDLKGPQLVIMVPTRELGVQIVMLIYKLYGGAVNSQVPGDAANMFTYTGPRGLKVKGVLDQEEVLFAKNKGYLYGTHVVVGLPECLVEAGKAPHAVPVMQHTRAVAVDEVDACFLEQGEAMQVLLSDACQQQRKPTIAFVGATIQPGLSDTASSMGWLDDPVHVSLGLDEPVPPGLQHRYMVVPAERKLAVLCRQIRVDLKEQGDDAAPTRVMVFAPTSEAAQACASPIRNVLWGAHKVAVLLPKGEEPIKALHSFRDNKSSLLIATPQAARGLDLPAVSHVYNLGPPENPTEYLHRAGRAGRIGSPVGGVITTLVTPEHESALLTMAEQLKIKLEKASEPAIDPLVAPENGDPQEGADVDRTKQGLEDIFNMY